MYMKKNIHKKFGYIIDFQILADNFKQLSNSKWLYIFQLCHCEETVINELEIVKMVIVYILNPMILYVY